MKDITLSFTAIAKEQGWDPLQPVKTRRDRNNANLENFQHTADYVQRLIQRASQDTARFCKQSRNKNVFNNEIETQMQLETEKINGQLQDIKQGITALGQIVESMRGNEQESGHRKLVLKSLHMNWHEIVSQFRDTVSQRAKAVSKKEETFKGMFGVAGFVPTAAATADHFSNRPGSAGSSSVNPGIRSSASVLQEMPSSTPSNVKNHYPKQPLPYQVRDHHHQQPFGAQPFPGSVGQPGAQQQHPQTHPSPTPPNTAMPQPTPQSPAAPTIGPPRDSFASRSSAGVPQSGAHTNPFPGFNSGPGFGTQQRNLRNRRGGGLNSPGPSFAPSQQQQNQQYINGAMYQKSRGEQVQQVEKQLNVAADMMLQITNLVNEQQYDVDNIVSNIDQTQENVELGRHELMKYYNNLSGDRQMILKIFAIVIILGVLFLVMW